MLHLSNVLESFEEETLECDPQGQHLLELRQELRNIQLQIMNTKETTQAVQGDLYDTKLVFLFLWNARDTCGGFFWGEILSVIHRVNIYLTPRWVEKYSSEKKSSFLAHLVIFSKFKLLNYFQKINLPPRNFIET